MIIDSQNLIISVQCRRFGDYMSSRLNECCITTDIRNILKRPNNSDSGSDFYAPSEGYTALQNDKILLSKATKCFLIPNFIIDVHLNLPVVGMAWGVSA